MIPPNHFFARLLGSALIAIVGLALTAAIMRPLVTTIGASISASTAHLAAYTSR